MIGSREVAQQVFNATVDSYTPDGLVVLGSGLYRHAYLGPDGVVYKVGDSETNRVEVQNSHVLRRSNMAKKLRDIGVNIPMATAHRVSIRDAMAAAKTGAAYDNIKSHLGWNNRTHLYVTAMEYVQIAPVEYDCPSRYPHRDTRGVIQYPDVVTNDCDSCDWDYCPAYVANEIDRLTGLCDTHVYNMVVDLDSEVWLVDLGQ